MKVKLTPSDLPAEALISNALDPESRGLGRDLSSAVSNFIRNCAAVIMAYGFAVYEIVYFEGRPNRAAHFALRLVLPRTIVHRRGRLLQYVPENISRQLNVPQYIQLSEENVLRFDPPAYVGQSLSGIMENLSSLSRRILPDFAMEHMKGTSNVPFDSTTYLRLEKLALAESTKLIGWNARNLLSDELLEYYFLRRQLLFEQFIIALRDSILSSLNKGLKRVGDRLGFSTQVSIEAVRTLADTQLALSQLEAGDIPFNDVLKPFLT
jgi:hypothetical protein